MSDPILLRAGRRTFTRTDVLSAAEFRSGLDSLRDTIRRGLACQQFADDEEFEIDADDLQAAAERYRIDRDLSTAEDTERWLADNDLTLEDFTAWLERCAWRDRFADRLETLIDSYDLDPDSVEALVWPEVVFGDHLDDLTRELAARVSVLLETGTAADYRTWADELAAMERAYQTFRAEVLQPATMDRELQARRSAMMRFEAELASFRSLDAAREAWLCASRDGEPFETVAEQAGAAFERVERFLDEFPGELQTRVLSSAVGEVLPPVEDGGAAFLVCRIAAKRLPEHADEPAVRERLQATLVTQAVQDLVRKHVTMNGSDPS